jgi:hypothetical protein
MIVQKGLDANMLKRKKSEWVKIIIYLIILLFLSIGPAMGSVYYVDNSENSKCNNIPGFGGELNPWCTIQYGIENISGGDELIVKKGVYNETIIIAGPNGNANKSTVVKSYPGHKPKLRGNNVNTGRIKLVGAGFMKLSGFEITNYNQGIRIENSNYIIIENCIVHFIGQEAISAKYNSSHITIQNNEIYDTGKWQYNGEGIYIGSGSGKTQDNTNNVLIKNNKIYNVADEAIELKPGTHDCTIDQNLIYNTPDMGPAVGTIEVNQSKHTSGKGWDSNPKHVIKNNIIHTGYTGIRAGTGCLIYNNLIYNINPNSYGIYVDNIWSGDTSYPRMIYHNTIDIPESRAVHIHSGTIDIKNNIGPLIKDNLPTSDQYYVNKQNGNYRLVTGTAPIDAGINLTAIVHTDIEGNSRLVNYPPDLGAYEYIKNLPGQ